MYGGDGERAGTGLCMMMSLALNEAEAIAYLLGADTRHTRVPSVSHRSSFAGAAPGLALERERAEDAFASDSASDASASASSSPSASASDPSSSARDCKRD